MGRWLTVLALGAVSLAAAQPPAPPVPAKPAPAVTVAVLQPPDGTVVGWGRERPSIVFSASALRDGARWHDARLFLTAQVTSGSFQERVPLYDNGSHGDQQADDGVYTGSFDRPPQPGEYTWRVRAFWGREAWSAPQRFSLERIPYAHVVQPAPGDRVRQTTPFEAVLLLDGQPLTQPDPSLTVRVQVANSQAPPEAWRPAAQRPSRVEHPLEFDRLGPQALTVVVGVQRQGRALTDTSEPVPIDVSVPPAFWLWAGGVLLLLGWLLPPKRAVPLVRRRLRVRRVSDDGEAGEVIGDFTLEPDARRRQERTVGGEGSDWPLPEARGPLVKVAAAPGDDVIEVTALAGTIKPRGLGKATSALIRPGTAGESFRAGAYRFDYSVEPAGQRRFARWKPSTLPKRLALAATLAALALGAWQYASFVQKVH